MAKSSSPDHISSCHAVGSWCLCQITGEGMVVGIFLKFNRTGLYLRSAFVKSPSWRRIPDGGAIIVPSHRVEFVQFVSQSSFDSMVGKDFVIGGLTQSGNEDGIVPVLPDVVKS